MTHALETGTASGQMCADYIQLVQRMIAYITKQESDARGWIKDPGQLKVALAALAERKDTAQKLSDALAEPVAGCGPAAPAQTPGELELNLKFHPERNQP
jgi:hypothetical protein